MVALVDILLGPVQICWTKKQFHAQVKVDVTATPERKLKSMDSLEHIHRSHASDFCFWFLSI